MYRSLLDAVPHSGFRAIEPALIRSEAVRLRHAREDHAKCMRIAAYHRHRMSRGERGLRSQHDWALNHCRVLRRRFPNL
ncbi:hypothetical protein ACLBYG_22175 [Methylobacterium sp. D53M]